MTKNQRAALTALRDVMREYQIEFSAEGSERFILIEDDEKTHRFEYFYTDLFDYGITKILEQETE